MNRIVKTILLLVEIIAGYLILSEKIISNCIIKKLFFISCPACGLTRSFRAILSGHFLEAIQYNLLSIPVFILFMIVDSYLIYDIIKNKKKTDDFLNTLGRYSIFIVVVLLLNMVINNVKGI